jgi:hypothetical protein
MTGRCGTAAVVTGTDGVYVRAVHRSWRVQWGEVVRFGTAPAALGGSSVYITVELADGSRLMTSGLTAALKGNFLPRVLSDLEAVRAEALANQSGQVR